MKIFDLIQLKFHFACAQVQILLSIRNCFTGKFPPIIRNKAISFSTVARQFGVSMVMSLEIYTIFSLCRLICLISNKSSKNKTFDDLSDFFSVVGLSLLICHILLIFLSLLRNPHASSGAFAQSWYVFVSEDSSKNKSKQLQTQSATVHSIHQSICRFIFFTIYVRKSWPNRIFIL